MESELRHKLFPPNAWMKVLHFNILTSCPKDELHQWFIGLYGEHIIPAIVHRYTKLPAYPCPGQWQSIMRRCSRLYPVTAISVFPVSWEYATLF
jgi:hypothetical protein